MSRRGGTGERDDGARAHPWRTRVLAGVWIAVALGCLARTAQLQLAETEDWRDVARAQNAAREEVPAPRGGLYDRDGEPLALESTEFRGYLAPGETPELGAAASRVARILDLSAGQERRLRSGDRGWNAIPRIVSLQERERLLSAVRRGLHFQPVADRVHPQGGLALNLLGGVSPEGEGRWGLEMELDSLLRGEPGAALRRRDALGGEYRLPDAQIDRPRSGHDVRLTLDAQLQRLAQDALERALAETGASGGDVLMMDPASGEILALASRRVDGDTRVPAFTDPYEPGSTLKPFLLASLLADGKTSLGERVDTEEGVLERDGRVIRDVHEADTLTVAEVIRYSSNVGAAKLSERLPPGVQYRYLRDFGFGLPTGIEHPAESPGRLRRPEDWSGFSQASLAMGYEVSVTSLQLAAAYAALANGGVLVRPHLVREVRAPDGSVVHRTRPEEIRRVIPRAVADRVTEVLSSVVQGGTGSRAAMATLPMAGKTGTARVASAGGYEEGRYAASFVGYTPAEDPSLVILTKLDDPQGQFYGGLTAAPISRSTLQAALATRGVALPRGPRTTTPPRYRWTDGGVTRREGGSSVFAVDGPHPGAASGSPSEGSGGQDARRILPDLRGLPFRTAAARLHELGFRVMVRGSGEVASQQPPPGATARSGARIVLR